MFCLRFIAAKWYPSKHFTANIMSFFSVFGSLSHNLSVIFYKWRSTVFHTSAFSQNSTINDIRMTSFIIELIMVIPFHEEKINVCPHMPPPIKKLNTYINKIKWHPSLVFPTCHQQTPLIPYVPITDPP